MNKLTLPERLRGTLKLIAADIAGGCIDDEDLAMALRIVHENSPVALIWHSDEEVRTIARKLDAMVSGEQQARQDAILETMARDLSRAARGTWSETVTKAKGSGLGKGSGAAVANVMDPEILALQEEARMHRMGCFARFWHRWFARKAKA